MLSVRARSQLLVLKVLSAPVYNDSVGAPDASEKVSGKWLNCCTPVYNNSLGEMRVSGKVAKVPRAPVYDNIVVANLTSLLIPT